jgi:hypothetical protein
MAVKNGLKTVMVSKIVQLKKYEKTQNHCHGGLCLPLEIAPQLLYRWLGRLHDVTDHYKMG